MPLLPPFSYRSLPRFDRTPSDRNPSRLARTPACPPSANYRSLRSTIAKAPPPPPQKATSSRCGHTTDLRNSSARSPRAPRSFASHKTTLKSIQIPLLGGETWKEVENYLYLSSSYQTTISNLSNQNILDFDKSTLDKFESLAQSGSTYQEILEEVYDIYGDSATEDTNDEEESSPPETQERDTLFLGDSRVTGMVNAGILNTSNTIYSNGYGFDWLEGTNTYESNMTNSTTGGIAGINNLMQANTTYNIVIMFGINDLDTSAEDYYQ